MAAVLRLDNKKIVQGLLTLGFMLLFAFCGMLFAEEASAHGYVENSRPHLCAQGQNTNCGNIVYEPQSQETQGNFPSGGPVDGQIAGAGGFTQLNEQTNTRWTKINMRSGTNSFTWKSTAQHSTENWRYYITKTNWNPNAPLTRDQLELTPFCTINGNNQRPAASVTHQCNVPSRTGYHLILAVWEISDTVNAFYNVIDVNFGGTVTDTQAPTAPSNLRSTGVTSSSVALAWNASTDNVGVTGYRVLRGTTQVATVSGSTLSYTVTGLTANTGYSFTVQALDAAGNVSASSNAVSATTSGSTGDTQAPTAPTNLRTTGVTSSSISLAWNASSDNVGVTGYRILRGTTTVATVSGTTLSYTVTGLASGTSYTFTVQSLDAAGNVSAASNAVSATTSTSSTAPAWAPNTAYAVGNLVTYNGSIYECRQAHTSLTGWEPPNVPALWLLK